jgi:beta-lactamase class A
MRLRLVWLLAVLCPAVVAFAQDRRAEGVLERLFTDSLRAEWFAPAFLEQVAPRQLEAIINGLRAQYGSWLGARGAGTEFEVELERAWVPTQLVLDGQGRIAGLFFRPPQPKATTLEGWLEAFRALPGEVALLVREGEREVLALEPERPLAVGSAFKLAILAALKRDVQQGRRRWEEVLTLRAAHRSLPSGILQNWPDGAPLTLYSLAALMISLSDNTATDHLLALVGRDAVERISPRNQPFLSTREAFVLKNPENKAWLARFRSATPQGRTAMLRELAALPLPGESVFASGPVAPDVEWFFTARELAVLLEEVADLPFFQINPGPVRKADWARVAFKGGSEPGVLNLSTHLVCPDGRRFTVIATWNGDQALDEVRFVGLYSGLVRFLATLP